MVGRRSIESEWSAHFGKLLENDRILARLPRNEMEDARWRVFSVVRCRGVSHQENVVLEPQNGRDYACQRVQRLRQGSIPCSSPSSASGLGISALPSPSGVNWRHVPSPSPATSCFPLLLHDTQLTPSFMIRP